MTKVKLLLGLILLLNFQQLIAQNDWENELMFEQNKMKASVLTYSFKISKESLTVE